MRCYYILYYTILLLLYIVRILLYILYLILYYTLLFLLFFYLIPFLSSVLFPLSSSFPSHLSSSSLLQIYLPFPPLHSNPLPPPLFCSSPSNNSHLPILPSPYLIFFPSQYSFPTIFSSIFPPSLPLLFLLFIHSIRVGIWISLFIFYQYRTIWPRMFYRSGWLRCVFGISVSVLVLCFDLVDCYLCFVLVFDMCGDILLLYTILLYITIILYYTLPSSFPRWSISSSFLLLLFYLLLFHSSQHSSPILSFPFPSQIFILYVSVLT